MNNSMTSSKYVDSQNINNITPPGTPLSRIDAIDILRGLVILIMMLDHVRERFFMHQPTGDPMYETIPPELYFTRYITHFCAPVFIFLAGMSAWLYAHPANGPSRSPSSFLFKRGLVLVMFEVVLYNLLWIDLGNNTIYLQVLWAIGISMIGLSLACRLNYWLMAAIGLIITFGHDALSAFTFSAGETGFVVWSILNENNNIAEVAGITIRASYPVLAWFGVILLGYCAGPLYAYTTTADKRQKWLFIIGITCLLLMLILRGFNLYGQAQPWSIQDSTVATVMSFLNFSKYPPSLNYLLVTLGIGCILLALFEILQERAAKVLSILKTFGSVPMFVYFAHLYVLLAAYWICYFIFGPTHGERFGLDTVGMIWLGAAILTLALYLPSKKFAEYKHNHKHTKPWLSYL